MKAPEKHIIYTIGHSTHPLAEFMEMLHAFHIKVLADIRRLPGSRKYPQYDMENLARSLAEKDIRYIHLADLGGRRNVKKDSKNNRWKNPSFRGYADYMETETFKKAAAELERIAYEQPTVYMCSEAVWWRCHRSMVSDYLKAKGWTVLHIMGPEKTQEHPYTSAARILGSEVSYADENLFNL